jgi:hypothetical protein
MSHPVKNKFQFDSPEDFINQGVDIFKRQTKEKAKYILDDISTMCQGDFFDSLIDKKSRELLESPLKDTCKIEEFAFIMNDASNITAFCIIKLAFERLEKSYDEHIEKEAKSMEGK